MDRKHAVMTGCTTAGATSGSRPENVGVECKSAFVVHLGRGRSRAARDGRAFVAREPVFLCRFCQFTSAHSHTA
jgi:hypothetical protein